MISDSAFLASDVMRKIYLSAEEQSEALQDFEQEYQQISTGQFNGNSGVVQLSLGFTMLLESYNQLVDQWGAVNRQTYCILFLLNGKGRSGLGNLDVGLDDIIIIPPGASYDLISYPSTYYCALNFEKAYLDPYLAAINPNLTALAEFSTPSTILHNPRVAENLRSYVHNIMQMGGSTGGTAIQVNHLESQKWLAMNTAATLMSSWVGEYHKSASEYPDHRNIAYAARDVLRKTSHLNYTIELFSQSFGVSRRTLEKNFQECFGLCPSHYKRIIKLNKFQKALTQPCNFERSIGDIAADHGYWHLSRLAQQFKSHFGELPSQFARVRRLP